MKNRQKVNFIILSQVKNVLIQNKTGLQHVSSTAHELVFKLGLYRDVLNNVFVKEAKIITINIVGKKASTASTIRRYHRGLFTPIFIWPIYLLLFIFIIACHCYMPMLPLGDNMLLHVLCMVVLGRLFISDIPVPRCGCMLSLRTLLF